MLWAGRVGRGAIVVLVGGLVVLAAPAAADTPVYSVPFDDPIAAAAAFGLTEGSTELDLGYGTATFTPGALTIDVDGNEQVFLEPTSVTPGSRLCPKDVAVEATVAVHRARVDGAASSGSRAVAERGRGMYACSSSASTVVTRCAATTA